MSKMIKEELLRMKNLFGYERGKVISEQKFLMTEEENLGCINNQVQSTDESDAKKYTFTRGDGKSGIQRFYKNGTWSYVTFSGDIIKGTWKCKGKSGYIIIVPTKQASGLSGSEDPISWPSSTSSFYFDSAKNTNSFDPKGWTEGSYTEPVTTKQKPKQTQNTSKTTTKPVAQKPKYVKPKEISNIKDFQDWLDDNHSDEQEGVGKGWATGFPGGKLAQGQGYGTYGPRSNAAWTKYGNEYGKLKSLPIAPVEPKQITIEPVKVPTELKPMQQINTQNIIQTAQQTVTPEKIYKTLYDAGRVQGEGNNRVKIDVSQMDQPQIDKLGEYMTSIGYEFRKRKNNGRLVYVKKGQPEEVNPEENQPE